MNYKEFLEILMTYKKISEDFRELYSMGFDFAEGKYKLEDNVGKMLDTILNLQFTEEGVDWINWFIYENDWGQKDWSGVKVFDYQTGKLIEKKDPINAYGARDENGNPICYSFETTWEYVKQYLKNKTDE
jgi:hypothetical protein